VVVSSQAQTSTLIAACFRRLRAPTPKTNFLSPHLLRSLEKGSSMSEELRIPISASMRHVHLCRQDVEALFGAGHQLTPAKALSQPGQFACEETVTICGPKGRIERVRVLGPERQETQLEISRTDEFKLGVEAPIRASGEIEGTPGIRLEGPEGAVELEKGVIQAARHIHMTPADGERLGVEDRQWVMVRVGGKRGIIFDDVLVRVNESYLLDMHLDTDEANAADLGSDAWGVLIKGPTGVAPDPND
jgi:propanediol utilization protein